jgi:hypothetical protein
LRDTIAAALADLFVDHQAQGGFDELAARPQAALLGGALLIVNDRGHTGQLLEFAQHFGQIVAIAQLGVGGQFDAVVFLQVVGEHRDLANTIGRQLVGQLGDGHGARGLLAAGHGHGTVVQDLVSDVDAGRDAGFHGQRCGMKIGAVADVLENVRPLDEGGHADPRRALAAHVGEERVGMVRVLELRGHGVAAYATAGHLAFQQQGGAIMRAAGAEVRKARGDQAALACVDFVEKGEAGNWNVDKLGQHAGDRLRVQFTGGGEQRRGCRIALAENSGAIGRVVQRLAQL